jgi:hypothetical protein
MKYYINENKEIFGFELDGSQDYLITEDMNPILLEEIEVINKAKEEASFEAMSYAEKRASEYPPITDYMDAMVKGDTEAMQEYVDKCLAIKAKYPKP